MPRVHTQKARADIYYQGLRIPAKTKSGTKIDRSKPADQNDNVKIPKGSIYYKWTFRYGGTHRSLNYPKPSQLTSSDFLQQVYSIGEDIPKFETNEDVSAWIEETILILDELLEQTEESLFNMPESLQYSPNGELLQERINSLEEWRSELEYIETESYENLEDLLSELPSEYYGM